jgi:4-hydroxybenzoate polyprenyltransferase
VLNAVVTVTLALLAGGPPEVAARLGVAMLAIQVAVGATNDLADADRDAVVKPGKPIPAGLVRPGPARLVAVSALAIGLALAATVSPGSVALAATGASAGLLYDLRLKGTVLAWLPFSVGIPLLLLFAWWGARQELPPALVVAAALAIPAGAALAIANALPDLERDARSGVQSVATILGRRRASGAVAGLQLVVGGAAIASYLVLAASRPFSPDAIPPAGAGAVVPAGAGAIVPAGVALAGGIALLAIGVMLGLDESVPRRQRGWEAQAVALGIVAAAWLGGLASAGGL